MSIKKALENIYKELKKRKEEISKLDRQIGDGDHALNMIRGFKSIAKKLTKIPNQPSTIFTFVGKELMNEVGGTSGAIYGMAFLSGAIVCKNKKWNFMTLMEMIETAAKRISSAGGAHIGEKTLFDVWGSIARDQKEIKSPEDLEEKMLQYVGLSKKLVATKGRASYLGRRSSGTIDPGCVTSEIIIRHLSQSV